MVGVMSKEFGGDNNPCILPLILCGGAGSRLAPLYGRGEDGDAKNACESIGGMKPKQFHKIGGSSGLDLLQATLARVGNKQIFHAPLVYSHVDYERWLCQSFGFYYRENLGRDSDQYAVDMPALISLFLEPERRNTAAPVLLGAFYARRMGVNYILVLPSDHIIHDVPGFERMVIRGLEIARNRGEIVYFGVEPEKPETAYGYICADERGGGVRFYEKPDATYAEKLIKHGALWNSGIFLIPTLRLLEDAEKLSPDVHALAGRVDEYCALNEPAGFFLDQNERICAGSKWVIPARLYNDIPDVAFDRFYCERVESGGVLQADFDWCDIGSPERYIAAKMVAA